MWLTDLRMSQQGIPLPVTCDKARSYGKVHPKVHLHLHHCCPSRPHPTCMAVIQYWRYHPNTPCAIACRSMASWESLTSMFLSPCCCIPHGSTSHMNYRCCWWCCGELLSPLFLLRADCTVQWVHCVLPCSPDPVGVGSAPPGELLSSPVQSHRTQHTLDNWPQPSGLAPAEAGGVFINSGNYSHVSITARQLNPPPPLLLFTNAHWWSLHNRTRSWE